MKKKIFFSLLVFPAILLNAQEFHFTQFNNPSMLINPAHTGVMNRDLRVSSLYRSQYGSVKGNDAKAFSTTMVSADASIFPKGSGSDFWGIGLTAYQHNRGFDELNTTSASLSASFSKALNASGSSFLSLGILGAYAQLARGNPNIPLTWDSQWDFNKSSFNSALPANEDNLLANGRRNFNYADISAGALFNGVLSKSIQMTAGLALWHINGPNISFSKTDKAYLNRKLVFHTQWDIATNYESRIRLVPSLCYIRQGTQQLFNVGIGTRFMLSQASVYTDFKKQSSFFLGLNYRHKEALCPIARLEYRNIAFGASYDVNISKLRTVSNGNGAMEFFLILNTTQGFGGKAKTRKIRFL